MSFITYEKKSRIQSIWLSAFWLSAFIVMVFGASAHAGVPDWVREARIGGADLSSEMNDEELMEVLTLRQAENVSVLEIDTRLSEYLTEEEFDKEVAFLDHAAQKAHELGMYAVIYYPSLEVLTPNGVISRSTMYKDHPDWVQYGINGDPNVFYGNKEHWVDANAESAWMSPNSPYADYFISRVRKLAGTALDGIWIDVPVYLETGTNWAGAGSYAAEDFKAWSVAEGLSNAPGLNVPRQADFNDAGFRAWVRWRHENIADFLESVRASAQQVNPEFLVAVEDFPVDNMDATSTALDGGYRRSDTNFIRVWEVDSVSNTLAMQWSNYDDFDNKIAMYKWTSAIEAKNPAWVFSYGAGPLDAGLVLAAAVAAGNTPFEAQTPEMTLSVDSNFRQNWFGFIRDHSDALFKTDRFARIGVWYSSATRDYQDFVRGGGFGLYATTQAPNNDPDWWASDPNDGIIPKPHLGGWRGAAHTLIQLKMPFKVVADPGLAADAVDGLSLLWLPSVAAVSDASAELIRDFVASGGILLATGEVPGTLNEWGDARGTTIFADLFGTDSNPTTARVNRYGAGLAIYRPDIKGSDTFGQAGDPDKAADTISAVEQLIRIHVPQDMVVESDGVFVDSSRPSEDLHHLYVVNYSGLQLPLVSAVQKVTIHYRAPEGFQVAAATVATPDAQGQSGDIAVIQSAENTYRISFDIDQFSLVSLFLSPKQETQPAPYGGPVFTTPKREEAARAAMAFILDKMRNHDAPPPYNYGVFTNLIDDPSVSEIYAHGHHVTAEHMGLLLRASACMNDADAYNQAYEYVKDAMVSPLYHVVNWAVDKDEFRPFIEPDEDDTIQLNANAPLDDFRVVRGLIDGAQKALRPEARFLAEEILQGLYWTSVTDRDHDTVIDYPLYDGGLMGFAWDWAEVDDPALSPPARATGMGRLTMDLIPVDYQDLETMGLAAGTNVRWRSVLHAALDLLLAAEIRAGSTRTGLFYNGYEETGNFTGDFENQDISQGRHLKTIQVLWTAIHLARAAQLSDAVLGADRKSAAKAAAERCLNFFKSFYQDHARVPEYLTTSGQDVADCTYGRPIGCLERGEENLFDGEARIYALLSRLALLLDDHTLAAAVIEAKILPDRISDPADPRYGLIGASTTGDGDAEAWNVLESAFTLCLEATVQSGPVANHSPVAQNDTFSTKADTGLTIAGSEVLANDSDFDGDPVTIIRMDTTTAENGTVADNGDNTFTYSPPAGYTGVDSWTYQISDGNGGTAGAVISMVIRGENNNAPLAVDDGLSVNQNETLNFTAAELLENDSDPDGDPLTIVAMDPQTANGITIFSTSDGGFSYTAPADFSGADSFSYQITDNNGGNSTATVTITVVEENIPQETSAVLFPQTVQVAVGSYDWGTLESLKATEYDTYDIRSALQDGQRTVDWYAVTTYSGAVSAITRLDASYSGHYSRANVNQEVYLFNFAQNQWDLIDTRTVGNDDNVTIAASIDTRPARYLSAAGELRLRVRGVRSSLSFYVWADQIKWEVF